MSIATKLAKLKTIKQDIKSALEEKGQTPSNVFSTYANNIRAIESGGITPSGEIEITENGTYDVTNYASANVNVAGSGGSDIDKLIDGSITELTSNATSIRNYAFNYLSNLTSANFPNATNIGYNIFDRCSNLKNANFPNATTISNNMFSYCISLTSVNMPKAKSIGGSSFRYCSALTKIDLPYVTTVGENAFRECSKLTNVNLPNATNINTYAFQACSLLQSINLPNVKTIGGYVFKECKKLTSVIFPNLTSVQNYGFSYCYSLLELLIEQTDSVCALQGAMTFYECYHIEGTKNTTYNPNGLKDGYIYVPASLLSQYKVATNWTKHASQIVGHQDYVVGDELVNYSNETYTTCTWYSDKKMTIEVSSVENNGRYYCKLEV